jgi:phosphoribosylglycinamide formyltransferase-1
MTKKRLAIFASGNGTNADAIMAHFKDNDYISVELLLTNNPNAYAIERARKFGVLCKVFTKQDFEMENVGEWLRDSGRITHIALAGFLWLIPENLLKAFPNKIINIHPALLPKYGGKGMYGMKVHEAVCANKELTSGITIHLVNDRYDEGEILAQQTVDITPTDTPQDIADKVHMLEYKYYPLVIESWIKAEEQDLKLTGKRPHGKSADSLKLWRNSGKK